MDDYLKDNYPRFMAMDLRLHYAAFQPPQGYPFRMKPCFFPANETEAAKRHLTMTRSRTWYDYTAKREFQTFSDWIASCGSEIGLIRFGFNKFDGRHSSVPIAVLLQDFNVMDQMTRFMEKLSMNGHSLRENVLIRTPEEVQSYLQYMNNIYNI
jgi:hypothetical protein